MSNKEHCHSDDVTSVFVDLPDTAVGSVIKIDGKCYMKTGIEGPIDTQTSSITARGDNCGDCFGISVPTAMTMSTCLHQIIPGGVHNWDGPGSYGLCVSDDGDVVTLSHQWRNGSYSYKVGGTWVFRKQTDGTWSYVQDISPGGTGAPAYWHTMSGDGKVIATGTLRIPGTATSTINVYRHNDTTQLYEQIGTTMTLLTAPSNMQLSSDGRIIAITHNRSDSFGRRWTFKKLSHDWDDPNADWVEHAPDIVGDSAGHPDLGQFNLYSYHGSMNSTGDMMLIHVMYGVADGTGWGTSKYDYGAMVMKLDTQTNTWIKCGIVSSSLDAKIIGSSNVNGKN